MNKHSIFIFTNNDSIKLRNILGELCNVKKYFNIHVIDDSNLETVIKDNIEFSLKISNNTYLGKNEFIKFYNKNYIGEKFQKNSIGTSEWNLGIARNFALDYSITNNYNKVLFIDDDISGITLNGLELGFKTLTVKNFISFNLIGKPDESVVGHIAKKLKIIYKEPRMLSGGFLFLYPKGIRHRFYNIYNEDWILQLMEDSKERIVLPIKVMHDVNNLIQEKINDIYFQELGEIVVEGLLIDRLAFNMDSNFWNDVISNRIIYIQELITKAINLEKNEEIIILSNLIEWLKKLTGEKILNTLNKMKNERTIY